MVLFSICIIIGNTIPFWIILWSMEKLMHSFCLQKKTKHNIVAHDFATYKYSDQCWGTHDCITTLAFDQDYIS